MADCCRIFYAKECPLKDDCSINSWKKAKCWSKDPNTVMTMVIDHLVQSGNHPQVKTREDAIPYSKKVELGHYDEVGVPAKKRKADLNDHDPAPPGEMRQPKTPPDALVPVNPRPKKHASSSASSREGREGSVSNVHTIVTTVNMNQALDAMHRAVATAHHAEGLCDRAAQQFRHDAQLLENYLETVRIACLTNSPA